VTAVALKVTFCSPRPSFPVRLQVSLKVPGVADQKVTVSVKEAPGAITVPSGSELVAVKPTSSPGGFDRLRVRGEPPVLETVKVCVATAPTATFAKLTVVGLIVMTGGGATLMLMGIETVPPVLAMVIESLNDPVVDPGVAVI
jgi:hypothetical protein